MKPSKGSGDSPLGLVMGFMGDSRGGWLSRFHEKGEEVVKIHMCQGLNSQSHHGSKPSRGVRCAALGGGVTNLSHGTDQT